MNRVFKVGNSSNLVNGNGEQFGTKENKIEVESTSQADILQRILEQLRLIEIHLYDMSNDKTELDDIQT
tara:strand:- start:14 stop:220 length:207 start_codon:yes stop_codon:yes gene_type:complete